MFFNGTCEEWVHEIQSQQRNSEKKIAPDLSRVKEIGKFYLEYVKSL